MPTPDPFDDQGEQRPVPLLVLAGLHPSLRKDGPDASDVHVNTASWKSVPSAKKRKRTHSAGGFTFSIPVKIQKALQRLDNAQSAAFAQVLLSSYGVLGSPSDSALAKGVSSGDGQPVIDSLNWGSWEAHLRAGLEPAYRAEAIRWGAATAKQLLNNLPMAKAAPVVATMSLQFAAKDPAVIAWIKKQVGALIVHISEETRRAIRDVIQAAYGSGIAPANAVPMVRAALGEPALFPAWQKAVFNYAATLVQAGTPGALELVAAYRDRLVKARSLMIARTEILAAQNAGRLASFQQAVDGGFVDAKTARKEWLAAPEGACPICDKLNGDQVSLDAKFSTGDMGPPAHPSCRCTTILRLGSAGQVAVGALEAGDFKKYNHEHDPRTGEFSSAAGGGVLSVATSGEDLSVAARDKVSAALAKFGTSVDVLETEIDARIGGPSSPSIVEGSRWYPAANALASAIATRTGLDVDRVIGVLAVISPQTDWDANARIGEQMCEFHASGKAEGLSPQGAMDLFISQTRSVSALPSNILKGFAVLKGAPIDATLGGTKVRSFYNNIADPGGTGEVTVDGHMAKAFGAASGLTFAEVKKLMGMKSVAPASAFPSAGYVAIAEAIRRVAGRYGVSPDAVQAAYWTLIRDAYKLKWPEKGA